VPGLRDRELALVGISLGAVSPSEDEATGALAAIGAVRALLASVGQRPTASSLGLGPAMLDIVATDALADPAIRNAPRQPTLVEVRDILVSVLA